MTSDASPSVPNSRPGDAQMPADDALKARYGAERNRPFAGKVLVIALVVLIAGAMAYAVNQFMNASSADVTAVESGGSVGSDNRLNMRVDVTREDPSQPAYCIVTAMDYDKNEVGRREFYIPAGGPETSRHSVDINTRVQGYAGKIYGCSSIIPSHLKQ